MGNQAKHAQPAAPASPKAGHGGARPNSGPKPCGIERSAASVFLSRQEREKLKALGGSKWLREILAAQS